MSLRPAAAREDLIDWAYRQAVARAGAGDLYSSWVAERYEMITPQDVVTAFHGLVAWVETGVRPTWPATL